MSEQRAEMLFCDPKWKNTHDYKIKNFGEKK